MSIRIMGLEPNTSRIILPTAYYIDFIALTTSRGERLDIRDLVGRFTMTESIHSNGIVLILEIKESANFMETYRIVGQEKVEISVTKQPIWSEEEDRINMEFYVSEISPYGRAKNGPNAHAFHMICLSPHVFLSKLTSISRALNPPRDPAEQIRNILRKDLNVTRFGTFEERSAGLLPPTIIPFMEPLKAADWIAQSVFGSDGSPFYLYETAMDGMNFRSHTSLVRQNSVARLFHRGGGYNRGQPQSREEFLALANNIVSINSEYRVSKLVASIGGAYASNTFFVDLGRKSFSLDQLVDGPRGNKLNPFPQLQKEQQYDPFGSLSTISTAHQNMFPENSLQPNYISNRKNLNYARAKSMKENMDSYVHDVVIPGNLKIKAGSVIELILEKTIDVTLEGVDEVEDKLHSGRYLVTSVFHDFTGTHTMKLRIKKDSLLVAP